MKGEKGRKHAIGEGRKTIFRCFPRMVKDDGVGIGR
jgi:hypothetical protein